MYNGVLGIYSKNGALCGLFSYVYLAFFATKKFLRQREKTELCIRNTIQNNLFPKEIVFYRGSAA